MADTAQSPGKPLPSHGASQDFSVSADGRNFSAPDSESPARWELPVETAVAVRYNGEDYAVMMATPNDLEDFALGFSLSEEILGSLEEIRAIDIEENPSGVTLDLRVRRAALAKQVLRRRRFAGRSGCGICGVQSLEDAVRMSRPVATRFRLRPASVLAGFERLPLHQPINHCNRSMHAAAWCTPDGEILFAREDVGRHNALDKLIGALARARQDTADGFVALTSRCSFELVQKAAAVGIPALASISAPTSLALELAQRVGIQVAARCDGGVVFFDRPVERPR